MVTVIITIILCVILFKKYEGLHNKLYAFYIKAKMHFFKKDKYDKCILNSIETLKSESKKIDLEASKIIKEFENEYFGID